MRDINRLMLLVKENTALNLYAQSIIQTSRRIDFRDLLYWSHDYSIVVASSYAGEEGQSLCQVYTYTFQILDTHKNWDEEVEDLTFEKNYVGPPHFKVKRPGLGKNRDWLRISQAICGGFAVSFVVPLGIGSIFTPRLEDLKAVLNPGLILPPCTIKPKELEKAYRVSFFGAIALFLVLRDGDRFFWQTDNDPIADGPDRLAFVKGLIGYWLYQLNPKLKCETMAFLTPFLDYSESNDFSEDLLAFSDLTASAVCEFFNQKNQLSKSQDLHEIVKQKAHGIMECFSGFKMFTYGIERVEKDYRCANYEF